MTPTFGDLSQLSLPDAPMVHLWFKFDQIKPIYPFHKHKAKLKMEELEKEDGDRWVEMPDDYLKSTLNDVGCKITKILVIEKVNLKMDKMPARSTFVEWYNSNNCIWPRTKGDDWRETMQTGDIVEAKDEQGEYYESLVRFVYPKDHKTMAGKCIIHYIGWNIKWDEPLDIDSDRIRKRYTHCALPHRVRQKTQRQLILERDRATRAIRAQDNVDVNAQNQEDVDLQRAIAASLGQI